MGEVILSESERRLLIRQRRAKGISQARAAEIARVSRDAYRRFEQGVDSINDDAWSLLVDALDLCSISPSLRACAHPGEAIRAARRRRGWSRLELSRRLSLIPGGDEWTLRRLQRLERGEEAWPIETCAAMARMLGLDPAEVGLDAVSPLLRLLHPMIWSLYYQHPADLVAMADLARLNPAALYGSIDGLWTMQAIGVALRDAGHAIQAWGILQTAAQHAAAHDNEVDLMTAVHMRLARAALDFRRLYGDKWATVAITHTRHAMRHVDRCRPRLQAVTRLTAAEALVAVGDVTQAMDLWREASRLARQHPGRDDVTGVAAHHVGVTHAIVRSLTPIAKHGDAAMRQSLTTALQNAAYAIEDPATPRRWRADIYASVAIGWATLGHMDAALNACSQATREVILCHSEKRARNVQRAIGALPVGYDRDTLLDALNRERIV